MKRIKEHISNNWVKWLGVILCIILIYYFIDINQTSNKKIVFSQFLDKILKGDIKEVNIKGEAVEGLLSNGEKFIVFIPKVYPQLIDDLRASEIKMSIVPDGSLLGNMLSTIFSWSPIFFLIISCIYYLKNEDGVGNENIAMEFGKSKATLVEVKDKKITFLDIAGIDDVKSELKEIVSFLKNPKRFNKLGGKIPKGCLLIGPPGTGKTLLAKAIAGEAGAPFFSISGSDFVEMFVGVGASRVRDMFFQAKQNTPCIIFIDEIDAVGRHRGFGYGGGNDEREQTLNQLLVEMDGFEENQGIIVIAATNRPDVIDTALLRAGRFDRQIIISNPDLKGREKILYIHMQKITAISNINVKVIARGTQGFTGADLANLINEAALIASRSNKKFVEITDLERAKDRILMGAKKNAAAISEEEKKITAYHESGHTIMSLYTSESEPIHKVTIIPRGKALGMLIQLPRKDKYHYTKSYFETKLAVAMGGRVAEEIIFGKEKVTTGASNDIKVATTIAKNMITKWGFNEEIGPIMLCSDEEVKTQEEEKHYNKSISEKTLEKIDKEVGVLLTNSYNIAKYILLKHKDKLKLIAIELLKKETITGYEIRNLLKSTQPDN